MSTLNPFLAEIRTIREERAKKFNYDLDARYKDIITRREKLKAQGFKLIGKDENGLYEIK